MFEQLVGLEIKNNQQYQQYRQAMKPILQRYQGEFGYDFVVSEVLKNEAEHDINRVFTIRFLDKSLNEAFFQDAEYKQVKAQHFRPAVINSTFIASYQK